MSAWLKMVPAWLWCLVTLLLVGGVQQYRILDAQRDLFETKAKWSEQLRLTAEMNAAVILKQQKDRLAQEGRLAVLDTQSTQELSHALSENDRLRDLYGAADDERRRLRIEVQVARADATVSATTSPGSLGDATSVELSAAAGRTVWNIRSGMISDRAQLAYLQEWVNQIRKTSAQSAPSNGP